MNIAIVDTDELTDLEDVNINNVKNNGLDITGSFELVTLYIGPDMNEKEK